MLNDTISVLFSSRELRAALAFWKENYPKWNIPGAFLSRGTAVKGTKCFCTGISNFVVREKYWSLLLDSGQGCTDTYTGGFERRGLARIPRGVLIRFFLMLACCRWHGTRYRNLKCMTMLRISWQCTMFYSDLGPCVLYI